MGTTKYDKDFDEMLEGKTFEGVLASDYLKADFTDDELEKLTKKELINLFAKAFVVICSELSESSKQLSESSKQRDEYMKLMEKLISHYQIYPHLTNVGTTDLEIDLAKNKAELLQLSNQALSQLLKNLPQIKAKAKTSIPSKGGKARAEKDLRTKALRSIEEEDYPKIKKIMHLRGRRTEFANNMLSKYPVLANTSRILVLIDRLNKLEGITQRKIK